MENERVVRKIEALYQERGWSVYRLSKESGIHQSTLSSLFARKSTISLVNLYKICRAFQMSMSQFFEEVDSVKIRKHDFYRYLETREEYLVLSEKDRDLMRKIMGVMLEASSNH